MTILFRMVGLVGKYNFKSMKFACSDLLLELWISYCSNIFPEMTLFHGISRETESTDNLNYIEAKLE